MNNKTRFAEAFSDCKISIEFNDSPLWSTLILYISKEGFSPMKIAKVINKRHFLNHDHFIELAYEYFLGFELAIRNFFKNQSKTNKPKQIKS